MYVLIYRAQYYSAHLLWADKDIPPDDRRLVAEATHGMTNSLFFQKAFQVVWSCLSSSLRSSLLPKEPRWCSFMGLNRTQSQNGREPLHVFSRKEGEAELELRLCLDDNSALKNKQCVLVGLAWIYEFLFLIHVMYCQFCPWLCSLINMITCNSHLNLNSLLWFIKFLLRI